MTTLNQSAPAATAPKGQSDSSHWYAQLPDGTSPTGSRWHPLYTAEKGYNLRDARKDKAAGKLVAPSVTTVFKVLHKQALLDWKMEQVARYSYALATTALGGALEEAEFVERAVNLADNSSRGAMDLGTRIHAAIELAIADQDYDAALHPYVDGAMLARENLKVKSLGIETCCGSALHGYAGKCDEHAEGMTILDNKSRKSNKNKTPKVDSYKTDRIQLAAYGYALFGDAFFIQGRGIILGISTTTQGLVTPHVFTGPELLPAWHAFLGLLQVWRFENNFDPRITT